MRGDSSSTQNPETMSLFYNPGTIMDFIVVRVLAFLILGIYVC